MTKENITSALREIGELENDKFKKRAYTTAVIILENMSDDEFNTRESFVDIKGIGNAINKKLVDYKTTGELPRRLYELREEHKTEPTPEYDPALYKVRKGFVTKRIPWNEAQEYARSIAAIAYRCGVNTLKEDNIFFLGSFRRQKKLIADLDVLVLGKDNYIKLVNELEQIYEVLVKGSRKTSFVIPNDEKTQIDVTWTTEEYLPFSMLHSTGSAENNIRLRHIAKEMGYTLNQYGLYNINTKERVNDIKTEEQIFEFLNIDYVAPDKR